MALSIWAVYCSHRRPWNMLWSTWEKTCKHRRHCWNLWVRLEDVVFHGGLFYWILRWKLVLKRFLLFSEMPWKIRGIFSGSCLLLVGSCQLKLPPSHWHPWFCQSTQSWSSRTVLWAWRVVVWALSLDLVGVLVIHWYMKWDGFHFLETRIDDVLFPGSVGTLEIHRGWQCWSFDWPSCEQWFSLLVELAKGKISRWSHASLMRETSEGW